VKEWGSMPAIGDRLGKVGRTNSASLIGVRMLGSTEDYSRGVAIGSGVHIDENTHIEMTRYPAGSDVMYGLATLLVSGRPGMERVIMWKLSALKMLIRDPRKLLRMLWPIGAAREGLIFLCMQAMEGHIDMSWTKPWFRPFGRKGLATTGPKVATYIPEANAFAEKFAKLAGGVPMNMITEILFDIPSTAHILGGCTMGATPSEGVVDEQNRLFGYENAYVCDGSTVSANLGVNPSLSIAALTERAMTYIPPASEAPWHDGALAAAARA